MFEVYCHTSPSGKCYVGWTSRGWIWRWRKHVLAANRGVTAPLQCAIRKYGAESFRHETLELCDTECGVKRAEVRWIASRGTRSPAGYNATSGGDGTLGIVPSLSHRKKLRESRLGKKSSAATCARISNAKFARGHKHSEVTRGKMSAARRLWHMRRRLREAWVRAEMAL